MKFRGIWTRANDWQKLLIFFGIVLFFWSTLSIIGFLIVSAYYGLNLFDPGALTDFSNPVTLRAMEVLQVVSQELGFSIVPSFFAAYVFDHYPSGYLMLNKKPTLSSCILVVLIMVVIIPFINWMVEWNSQMKFPPTLSWLEQWFSGMEKKAEEITDQFLVMNSVTSMMAKMAILAFLPALGEELMFRGLIQKFLSGITRNYHWGIFISAFLFSAIHFQFYGFVPRLLLGMLFGYLLVWSGSMYLPLLAHFLNNGIAVFFAYLSQHDKITFDQDKVGIMEGEKLMVTGSIVLTAFLLFLFFRNEKRKEVIQ